MIAAQRARGVRRPPKRPSAWRRFVVANGGPACVTFTSRYDDRMSPARTGAERYLGQRRRSPEYEQSYEAARRRVEQIDSIIRVLDQRRCNLELSKAELARRADLRPEVIRRLFSAESPNPTLSTLVALAEALDMELAAEPLEVVRAS